eukprot:c19206_g1_i4.p1 GENE.c19206_g1_i4~~c19206_g1_i4.p1  ORF type:complete len:406 (+),score=97.91 c19206_g1_i4:215-1432(+)
MAHDTQIPILIDHLMTNREDPTEKYATFSSPNSPSLIATSVHSKPNNAETERLVFQTRTGVSHHLSKRFSIFSVSPIVPIPASPSVTNTVVHMPLRHHYSVSAAQPDEDLSEFTRKLEDLTINQVPPEETGHIVVVCEDQNFFALSEFVHSLRCIEHTTHGKRHTVVAACKALPNDTEFALISRFEHLRLVHGSILAFNTQARLNLGAALCVATLAPGGSKRVQNNSEEIFIHDKEAIIVQTALKHLEVRVVSCLTDLQNFLFVGEGLRDTHLNQDTVQTRFRWFPKFISGDVSAQILPQLVGLGCFNPAMAAVLYQLLLAGVLTQRAFVKLQPIASELAGQQYLVLVRKLMAEGQICLGLYRRAEGEVGVVENQRYVSINPQPDTLLNESDQVYVLLSQGEAMK